MASGWAQTVAQRVHLPSMDDLGWPTLSSTSTDERPQSSPIGVGIRNVSIGQSWCEIRKRVESQQKGSGKIHELVRFRTTVGQE